MQHTNLVLTQHTNVDFTFYVRCNHTVENDPSSSSENTLKKPAMCEPKSSFLYINVDLVGKTHLTGVKMSC
jgi:hypothetical protein